MTDRSDSAVAVLFDGGASSSLAAIRMAEHGARVHLLTFTHRGLDGAGPLGSHRRRLGEFFGDPDRFIHRFLPVDRLLNFLGVAERRLGAPGLATAATCDLCRVVFVWRALLYSLEEKIYRIADGAVRERAPLGSEEILGRLRALNARFGVEHVSPVFEEGAAIGTTLFQLRYTRQPQADPSPLRCSQNLLRDSVRTLFSDGRAAAPRAALQQQLAEFLGPRLDLAETMTADHLRSPSTSALAALLES